MQHAAPELDDLFRRRGLGPNGRRIYEALLREPLTASALANQLGVYRSTVARNLAKMADVGIVAKQADATWTLQPFDLEQALMDYGVVAGRYYQTEQHRNERQRWRTRFIERNGIDPYGVDLETGEVAPADEDDDDKLPAGIEVVKAEDFV
jgi:DNA-binding transcriptional ArsR family regulator